MLHLHKWQRYKMINPLMARGCLRETLNRISSGSQPVVPHLVTDDHHAHVNVPDGAWSGVPIVMFRPYGRDASLNDQTFL
jgi:hypothetical protein